MNTVEPAISPDEAVKALESFISNYTLNSIRTQLFQHDHRDEKRNFEEKYNCWCYWTNRQEKTLIASSKSFDDRAAAMAWIKEKDLGEPEFSKFSFATNSGEPKTMCTLKCVGEFEGVDFEIEANYTRDGLPTSNCKVVASTSYSVVCELNA